jgi:hypothetical protein
MNAVVMRIGQVEPPTMDGFHPVSGENEAQKPDDKNQVIDRRAVQKKATQKVDVHGFSSVLASADASFHYNARVKVASFRPLKPISPQPPFQRGCPSKTDGGLLTLRRRGL